jgi:hypothetical protein
VPKAGALFQKGVNFLTLVKGACYIEDDETVIYKNGYTLSQSTAQVG